MVKVEINLASFTKMYKKNLHINRKGWTRAKQKQKMLTCANRAHRRVHQCFPYSVCFILALSRLYYRNITPLRSRYCHFYPLKFVCVQRAQYSVQAKWMRLSHRQWIYMHRFVSVVPQRTISQGCQYRYIYIRGYTALHTLLQSLLLMLALVIFSLVREIDMQCLWKGREKKWIIKKKKKNIE